MDGAVNPQDDHSHKHNGDERWQESWAFHFYDPVSRIAGYQHTGLQPVRGLADCWSWFTVRGVLVRNFSSLRLPMPAGDYTDLRLGPVHVKSLVPNLKRAVTVEDGPVQASVIYEAFQNEPIVLRKKGKGGYFDEISSDGHYETMGSVKGTLRVGNEVIQINGFGYDDRSWGKRVFDNMHYRVMFACFGPDLYCALYHVATHSAWSQFGWIFDKGRFHDVSAVEFAVETNNDGVTARGGKVRAWTQDNGGYAFNITCDGGSIITHRENFMASPGLGVVECGGRLGTGMLEFSEMKRATPELVDKYSLDIMS